MGRGQRNGALRSLNCREAFPRDPSLCVCQPAVEFERGHSMSAAKQASTGVCRESAASMARRGQVLYKVHVLAAVNNISGLSKGDSQSTSYVKTT